MRLGKYLSPTQPRTDTESMEWLTVERDGRFQKFLGKNMKRYDCTDDGMQLDFALAVTYHSLHDLVCKYANHQLAISMAELEWCRSKNAPIDQQYYLLESAITRHCCAWEYLFQMLTYILSLQEEVAATKADYNAILGLSSYDVEFIPGPTGTKVQYTPREIQQAVRDIRRRRQELDYVQVGARADRFFSKTDKKFARGTWLDDVKRLVRDYPVREVTKIRDQIIHHRPLGSSYRTGLGEALPVNGITFSKPAAEEIPETLKKLRQAQKRLFEAIGIVVRETSRSNIPNIRENEGVEYWIAFYRCPRCGKDFPEPNRSEAKPFPLFYCMNCSLQSRREDAKVKRKLSVSEILYSSHLRDYLPRLRESIQYIPPELRDILPSSHHTQ